MINFYEAKNKILPAIEKIFLKNYYSIGKLIKRFATCKKKSKKIDHKVNFANRFKYAKLESTGYLYSFVEITRSTTYAVNEPVKMAYLRGMSWPEKFWYLAKFRKEEGYSFYYA